MAERRRSARPHKEPRALFRRNSLRVNQPLPATPELVIDEDDPFDRLRLISWWDQARLAKARVMVIGAGALGNEVLKNLALLGIGHVVVIDMDRIETSNLSRSVLFRRADAGQPKAEVAARAMRELNPDLQVTALVGDVTKCVGLGWYADADVMIGCLDNREARMWVNRCCWHVKKPWIDGGIQEVSGVVQVFAPPDGTCYECGMSALDYQIAALRYSCPLLTRDDLQRGRIPTTPTISSIIAGWQVQEAVKLLHALPTAAGHALVFHGLSNNIYKTKLPRREDCLAHDEWPPAKLLGETPDRLTGESLLDQLPAGASIELSRELVTGLSCQSCGLEQPLVRPAAAITQREAICASCGQPMVPEFLHQLTREHPVAKRSLAELGVPAADILCWRTAEAQGAVRLGGDTFPSTAIVPEANV
jgi:adenylyltransferase/sulfurtransferase